MARERIEQEAVPVPELWRDTLQRADKALGRMSKGFRAAAFVGVIAGITTASRAKEGIIEPPAVSPAKGKEATSEASHVQAETPKIVVPPEAKEAPEYVERASIEVEEKTPVEEVSVEKTAEFLQDLQNKVDEIYELRQKRAGFGKLYVVQEGDTLWDIAERHRVSVDRLAELNRLWMPDSSLIYPGERLNMPEEVVPTPALGEIFAKVESDQEKLQALIEKGQSDSPQAKELTKEIINFWNTPPFEKTSAEKIEVVVHSECSEKVERTREMVQEFVDLFPNLRRLVRKIEIVPRKGGGETTIDSYQTYFYSGWVWTHKDSPADIYIREDYLNSDSQLVPWSKEILYSVLLHEGLAHGGSLYGGGYILKFLAPVQVVNFVYEDTKFWDEIYSQANILEEKGEYYTWDRDEEQVQASSVESLFLHSKPPEDFLTKEKMEKLENFLNKLYSHLLDSPVDVSQFQEGLLGIKSE